MGTILPIREMSDLKPRTVLSESNPNARAEIQSVNCIMVMLLITAGKKENPRTKKSVTPDAEPMHIRGATPARGQVVSFLGIRRKE